VERKTGLSSYCESLNSKLRDEFLNGDVFYSLKELRVLAERWRVHYNIVRPHSSLGYRVPAPAAWLTEASEGHGKVENKERFPLSHTPDYYDESYLSPLSPEDWTLSPIMQCVWQRYTPNWPTRWLMRRGAGG
jgi:Integrase core domain